MGDRCYMQITLHGHIEDLDTLDLVIEALKGQNMDPADGEGSYYGNDNVNPLFMKAFAHAIAFERNPQFVDDEHNYADISELESVLAQHNIAYAVYHGPGDEYSGANWAFVPTSDNSAFNKFEIQLDRDGDAVFTVNEIENLLNDSTDPLIDLAKRVHEARLAEGETMPQFSVGDELKRHLATLMGVEALSPATV